MVSMERVANGGRASDEHRAQSIRRDLRPGVSPLRWAASGSGACYLGIGTLLDGSLARDAQALECQDHPDAALHGGVNSRPDRHRYPGILPRIRVSRLPGVLWCHLLA